MPQSNALPDSFFEEMQHWDQAEDAFLTAWKQAVSLIGEHYFIISAPSVEAATQKEQLCPDPEQIEAAMGVASHGEMIVLANLYCFYNEHKGQRFIERLPDLANPVTQFGLLDFHWRRILTTLLLNFKGWRF